MNYWSPYLNILNPGKRSNKFIPDLHSLKEMSIYGLIKWGESRLQEKDILNPFRESALLMGYSLGVTFEKVMLSYGDNPPRGKISLFKNLIERRRSGEPFAYLTNKKEFYSIDFFVNKSVLIPRPDTECIVDEAIKEADLLGKILKRKVYVIDVGTGSGAIAIAIAKNTGGNVIVYAADSSSKSLAVAGKNINLNGVREKVIPAYYDVFKSNMLWRNAKGGLFGNSLSCFDIIISNPPYVKTGDIELLDDDVRLYEPLKALDGGDSGLKFYERIIDLALPPGMPGKNERPAGDFEKALIFEIDFREKEKIFNLLVKKFGKFNIISFINDLDKRERGVKIKYGQDSN